MERYKLLTPYELGAYKLSNRTVMSPMTRCRAINNVPNELMVKYYTQRSGAGLIITEGIAPSPNGLEYARIPGLFSQSQGANGYLIEQFLSPISNIRIDPYGGNIENSHQTFAIWGSK